MSINTLYQAIRTTLTNASIENPGREARLIIKLATGLTDVAQLSAPDAPVDQNAATKAQTFAARRASGEPLSRIRGTREFYGLDFIISPATLDPRPETEIIVDTVLKKYATHSTNLLDLGTGTGCIPISILKHASHMQATAIDISAQALDIAHQNATTHGVLPRINFVTSNWFAALPTGGRFDIITSNPPYIDDATIQTLDREVRIHDPILSLSGGTDGLDAYRNIFAALDTWLRPGGIALFEIGIGQADDIARLAIKYGLDAEPPILDDAGIPRVIGVRTALKNKVDSGA